MTFDPLAPGVPAPPPRKTAAPAFRALRAALLNAAPSVTEIAEAEIRAPSWREGQTLEHAAFVEGRKSVWRELLRLMEEDA